MALALTILKWIGLLLLILFVVLVLIGTAIVFVPVRYVVECRTESSIRVGVSATWFLRAVKLHKSMTDSGFHLFLFGIRLRGFGRRIQKKAEGKEDNHAGATHDPADVREVEKQPSGEKEGLVSIETDYEQSEGKKVSGKKKKSFSFDRISSIITFIRNEQNKKGFRKIRREIAALFKYLMPRQVRGSIVFGTGDPCTTGWVLGIVSMIPAAYADGLSIAVDFEDKKLDVDTYARGHMHLIYFIRMFVRGYLDADVKAVVHKVLGLF